MPDSRGTYTAKRSGQIALQPKVVSFARSISWDGPSQAALATILGGSAQFKRVAELFRHIDSARFAEEIAALREMVEIAAKHLEIAGLKNLLGLSRGRLFGDLPDPLARDSDRRAGRGGAPAGFGQGLASHNSRPNPMRDLLRGQPGFTADQYFLAFFSNADTHLGDRSVVFSGRDREGTVVGRDVRGDLNHSERVTVSTFLERDNDGTSRWTHIDHVIDSRVQITKTDREVVKHVQYRDQAERGESRTNDVVTRTPVRQGAGNPSGDPAGNPGDAPSARDREWTMWFWRQHNLGQTPSSGPRTVVFINPPGSDAPDASSSAPSIFDFVEVAITGDPDLRQLRARHEVPPPADYRARALHVVRDKIGGLVNPPGPAEPLR